MVVIHVCGASGSGKTTLGARLAEALPYVLVKDLDDLRDEYIRLRYGGRKWTYLDEEGYQKHIDRFVARATSRGPLVLTGLNDNTIYGKNKRLFYNVHADHRFYIDAPPETILRQRCSRLFLELADDPEALHDLVHNNSRFIQLSTQQIRRHCSLPAVQRESQKVRTQYSKMQYTMLSSQKIYSKIIKILNK